MNFRPILSYQLREYYKSFAMIYGVVYAMMVVMLILIKTHPDFQVGISGTESMTMLTCLVAGAVLFKAPFRFFSSFGVSRRRFFCGMTAAAGIVSASVALLDTVNVMVFSSFMKYNTLYLSKIQNGYSPSLLAKNFLWCLLSDFGLILLGTLAAVLFYRMSRAVKILVCGGAAAVCFILLPVLDFNVTHGALAAGAAAAVNQWVAWGMSPVPDLLSRLVLFVLLGGFTWLLLRRAEVKA